MREESHQPYHLRSMSQFILLPFTVNIIQFSDFLSHTHNFGYTLKCQICKGQFCPTHRMPTSHTCRTAPAANPASFQARQTPTSAAGIAALKRAAASATNSASSALLSNSSNVTNPTNKSQPSTTQSTSSSGSKPNLIQGIKTDRWVANVLASSNSTPTLLSPPEPDKKRSIVPDPTKKWVPASIFAAA